MPNATQQLVIVGSGQVNPGTILGSDIANDTITDANVNSAAAIAYSKLALTGAILNADLAGSIADSKLSQITTASKVSGAALTSLASIPAGAGVIPSANLPATGSKISIVTGDVTVSNTTTETNLLSVSIPGGTLGTDDGVRVRLFIKDFRINTSSAVTFRLKYGATTIASINCFSGSSLSVGILEALLASGGATNSQIGEIHGFFTQEANNNTALTQGAALGTGTGAEDSTGALNLVVSVQFNGASATDQITMLSAVVESVT